MLQSSPPSELTPGGWPGAPMAALRERVADIQTLYAAWRITRQRLEEDDPTAEGWPREAQRMERHLEQSLQELSERLLGGDWSPRPAQQVLLAKPDGSSRALHVPPVGDRVVERAIGMTIQPLLDPLLGPWSYAYRRGRGVADALGDLAWLRDEGLKWVVRSDFADCFDEVEHAEILQLVERELGDSWLTSVVAELLRRPVRANGRVGEACSEGLAQGGPLSPMLANLYLDPFDEAMAQLGTPLIRYGDDFTLLASSRTEALAALDAAHGVAQQLGMRLNEEKTQVTTFEDGFAFLGEDIGPVHPVRELAQVADGEVLQKSLHVTLQGAHVRIAKGQVIVSNGDQELLRAPQRLIGQLVLTGSVGLSAGVRSMALFEQLPVTFLSRRGSFLGRLDSAEQGRAGLRRAQYRAGDSDDQRLELARQFVAGKVANQRTLVQRYTRRMSIPTLVGAATSLRSSHREVGRATTPNALRGVEGSAARCYFGALATLLPDEAGFTGRRRRPPKDPANAALGYAYAILLGEAVSAISTVGLDPVAGFLHDDSERRPSLGLDLMEEFRPLIVDVVVLDLFRRRRLRAAEHFRRDGPAVLLNQEGRHALVSAYEERMLTLFHHVPSGKRVTYRRALTLQANQIVSVLQGRAQTYEPVPWR